MAMRGTTRSIKSLDGIGRYIGVDDAGRGALAGPVAVAAVLFPWNNPELLEKVADSKTLSASKREFLAEIIARECDYSCALIDPDYIDQYGIDHAEAVGAATVIRDLERHDPLYPALPHKVVLDGTPQNWAELGETDDDRYLFMVRGDAIAPAISAASIMAKVMRDHHMRDKIHTACPEYGFDQHVGYGTQKHLEALARLGPCPFHRLSFAPLKGKYDRRV